MREKHSMKEKENEKESKRSKEYTNHCRRSLSLTLSSSILLMPRALLGREAANRHPIFSLFESLTVLTQRKRYKIRARVYTCTCVRVYVFMREREREQTKEKG
jgi:hypothetical protein